MPHYLGLELTDVDVRCVVLGTTRKTAPEVVRAFRVALDDVPRDAENAAAERGRRLRDALREKAVPAGATAAIVVPKQSATVRRVRLPSNDPDELASMAAFEAEKIIPFNVERHIVSQCITRQHEIEGSDVLLAAIDGEVMQGWIDPVTAARLEPVAADVSSLALAYARLNAPDGEALRKGCVALLHIGILHTDITILLEGEVVTTRSVTHGVRNLAAELKGAWGLEADLGLADLAALDVRTPEVFRPAGASREPASASAPADGAPVPVVVSMDRRLETSVGLVKGWVQKLLTNIQRTYEFALREYSLPAVDHLHLSGDGALLRGLGETLTANLGVPTEVFSPLANAKRAAGATVDEALLPCFAVAYGAALRLAREEHGNHINVLPPEMISRQVASQQRLQYVVTGCIALVAVVMLGVWWFARREVDTRSAELYAVYIEEMEPLAREVGDKQRRMEIIADIRSDKTGALDILEAISAYADIGPTTRNGRLTLKEFTFTIDEEVRIAGDALTPEDVNKFVLYLEGLKKPNGNKFFVAVDSQGVTPGTLPRRDTPIYSFQLVGRLKA